MQTRLTTQRDQLIRVQSNTGQYPQLFRGRKKVSDQLQIVVSAQSDTHRANASNSEINPGWITQAVTRQQKNKIG